MLFLPRAEEFSAGFRASVPLFEAKNGMHPQARSVKQSASSRALPNPGNKQSIICRKFLQLEARVRESLKLFLLLRKAFESPLFQPAVRLQQAFQLFLSL